MNGIINHCPTRPPPLFLLMTRRRQNYTLIGAIHVLQGATTVIGGGRLCERCQSGRAERQDEPHQHRRWGQLGAAGGQGTFLFSLPPSSPLPPHLKPPSCHLITWQDSAMGKSVQADDHNDEMSCLIALPKDFQYFWTMLRVSDVQQRRKAEEVILQFACRN